MIGLESRVPARKLKMIFFLLYENTAEILGIYNLARLTSEAVI